MPVDQSRINELTAVLEAKTAQNVEIGNAFTVDGNSVVVTDEQKAAFQSNMKDIREIKSMIAGLREMDADIKSGFTPANDSVASTIAALQAGGTTDFGVTRKSLGEMFLESEEYKALNSGKNGVNMRVPFEYKGGDMSALWGGVEVKDVYSALPTGTPGSFGRVDRDPMVVRPQRRKRVRDLFPQRNTTAAVIEYFRMTGFTNNASVVGERNTGNTAFARKPQSSLDFIGVQAPTRLIAHWEGVHRSVLADEPQLRAIIDNELLYGLRLVEDAQILLGNGVGENLLGILNSGIQDYNWSSGSPTPVPDTKADAIRRALTLAYLAEYEPTGIVLHPNDYEDIELTKNTQGTYLFATSIQLGGEARMWRLPVVDTPAMPEGRALVGAFGTAAQLYDREEANIRISENHEDWFVRNAIVVLAEERLALAVKRPEAFVNVDFDMAPA